MRSFLLRSHKSFVSNVALWASFIHFLSSDFCYTQDIMEPLLAASSKDTESDENEPKYTVNFNNVPIIEVIRFVSKISNTNFVFSEEDLQFSVTIVSEEPISVKNIISALIQVLRIHELVLLEQDNSLLITKSTDVNQIPAIVSSDLPNSMHTNAPIVTRVFRIKNASVSSVANIIRPMTSKSALIEVSNETRQLIVTDITTNVEKIASLLTSLDAPHTPLEIESYVVKSIAPSDIISLTTQILSPFSEGNPLIFVPQAETNTIFIVSTPYLIDRAISVMEDIDVPPKTVVIGGKPAAQQNVYVYKILHRSPEDLLAALQEVAEQLQASHPASSINIVQALRSVKFISDTNSLLFVTDSSTWTKIQEILSGVDTAPYVGPMGKPTFLVYKIQHATEPQMEAALNQMAQGIQDKDLTNTINSMKWIKESNSLVFTGPESAISKLQSLLPSLDVATPVVGQSFYIYKIQNSTEPQIAGALQQMEGTIQDKDLIDAINSMKWIKESNSLVFSGTDAAIKKLQDILPTLDVTTPVVGQSFYIYKIQNSTEPQIAAALQQMAETIQDKDLSDTINSMKWIKDSNSLVFSGPETAIKKLQDIVPTLDVATPVIGQAFYIYKIKNTTEPQIAASLQQMAETIQDKDLVNTINSMKWIKESNSLVFTGPQAAITKLQDILPTLDVAQTPTSASKSHFLIYNPKYQKGEQLESDLEELAKNLKTSGLSNTDLLNALESMKWVSGTNSLIFTGDQASLDRIQNIIQTLDIPSATTAPIQIFIYKPVYASEEQLKDALDRFAQNLDPNSASDQSLAQAIHTVEWVPESQSFVFKADADTLSRLKEILASLDNPKGLTGGYAKGFYLYKLQYAPGNVVIQNLKNLADNLSSTDVANKNLIKAIDDLKWVKENNSLLITGSPFAIDQIKTLIAEFDVASAAQQPVITPKSEFFIYKPANQSPQQIQTSLEDLSKDLEESGLIDPDLLHTLNTMRYVPATNSLLFTGTPDALSKVKDMIKTIDVPVPQAAPIQKIGNVTFLIYKIKNASPTELINSLKSFAQELSKTDVEDKELAATIEGVKWIKETNSLLFTGPEDVLRRAETLVEKFDVSSLQPPQAPREAPATFVVYTPKYQSGDELITILCDFMHNLMGSGVTDKGLFDSISHLRFIAKTNSLVISGDEASIKKVQDLLARFDVPSKEPSQPAISTIDTTNFLIYKLQYHKGSDIQTALKQVATSLNKSGAAPSKNLIDAIESLQWIEVTNSLLGTGDPDMLTKLKDLIQNLDVPLRQVFIEVLVIETSLFNSQNFGLQWGTQLQYLNKTIGAMGNFPTAQSTNQSGTPTGTVNFAPSITNTTATNPPVQGSPSPNSNSVPFSTGFDLGVIGDIIMHKGKSFISLGGLLNALQVDNDTTVIMNPKIITQDGHTSSIFVGQNIPFIGSFVSNTTNSTIQTSNIEYRDVGVNLTITPTLGTNNVVTLDISQDISEQVNNTTQVQGAQVSGIQTSHTTMATRVHVPDKHFLVLSGMIQDTKTHFRSSIPCLGGIPVVGALFAENDRLDTKANVIIFLRPFIVNSFEDYDRLTAAEEDMYKDQAKLQTLKEEFDDGTEMIKSILND
jgi:type III secretion protein C